MQRTIWGSVLLALVLTVGLVGFGLVAFNAGVAQGLAQSGKLALPAAGGSAAGPVTWPVYPYAWGLGFGPLGCLIPLLLVLFLLALARGLFWRSHWGPGWGGSRRWGPYAGFQGWEKGYPPFFEAWHRRAHGEPDPGPSEEKQAD
jgi:hypothetical protein